jgi:transposase
VSYGLIERLYYRQAGSKALSIEKQPLPSIMSIDEFSGRKRVRMHLGIADLSDSPRLWDVMETKECTAFIDYFSRYSKEERDEVVAVVHDMDRGLKSWTAVMFKRAIHIIDKFHLTRTLLKYQERVRKAAYRKASKATSKNLIRSSYFLIKKRYDDLSDKEKVKLALLFAISKHLRVAYEFKEDFMRWYDRRQRRSEAESELIVLYRRLGEITHMKRFRITLDHWWDEILNYFVLNRTNGFLEGMNNKIKTLKRQAYGFRSFPRFRIRILNECAFN